MLTSVSFSNYRGFREYRLQPLGRVNLLVGMNNSGKTAALEGIQFLATGGDPIVLQQAAMRRGELLMRRPDAPPLVDISHFFYGHRLSPDDKFSFSGDNGHGTVGVRVVLTQERPEADSGSTGNRLAIRFLVKIDGGDRAASGKRIYPLSRDGGVIFDDSPPWRSDFSFDRIRKATEIPSRFLGTDLIDATALAEMLDGVAVSGNDAILADALRILEPKLEYIRQLSGLTTLGFRGSRAGVIAKTASSETPIPLGSLGEGMRRMLALAAALATTHGGFLFVDEIDTGLHYSVMHKMWELVATTAFTYDIQVFAATHSYDCILGLARMLKASPEFREYVVLHRIESGRTSSVQYEPQEILTAIREDIEVR